MQHMASIAISEKIIMKNLQKLHPLDH